jgi:glyoxylase-like metal-dependent hydrolase (beta-lactamase superfamily II)
MSVHFIDCHYRFPGHAGAYLMTEGTRAAFVETNTTHAVPRLMRALQERGLRPDQVDYVIVTHAHLDHASGAGALLNACPGAKLVAHPRAARHLIDPSKLKASAEQVYGAETFRALYGELVPVPAERVLIQEDESELRWGSRVLKFLHTRGHAKHHFCVLDSVTQGVFTGDSFGIYYPSLGTKTPFVFPSTSPTDFEPDEAVKTIDRLVGLNAAAAYLTHFGPLKEPRTFGRELKEQIQFSKQLVLNVTGLSPEVAKAKALESLRGLWVKKLASCGGQWNEEAERLLSLDLDLNAAGIAYASRSKGNP